MFSMQLVVMFSIFNCLDVEDADYVIINFVLVLCIVSFNVDV